MKKVLVPIDFSNQSENALITAANFAKKFDNNFTYIKKWVPEFQELTYPTPIVDHKFARERCLKTYKEALN